MKTNKLIAITALFLCGIIFESSGQTAWELNGNALATPNSNFLGTTNDSDLIFKRNSQTSGAINITNTSFGYRALSSTFLSGQANTAFGSGALIANSGGGANVALGYDSMMLNTTGANNVAIGWRALGSTTRGNNNVAIGLQALYYNRSDSNVAIGHLAGYKSGGKGNVFLGYQAGYYEMGSNRLYIHNSDASNPLIYGEFDSRRMIFNVNQTASSKMAINSYAPGLSGLLFGNLNSSSTAPANGNGKFLTVNGSGDVILETIPASISTNIYTADGILAGDRTVSMNDNNLIFNTATNSKVYIGNQTPAIPGNFRLYVEGGLLSERVKVALRSTTDWADYVFADDYKLMSLPEVEAFIKTNKHLPKVDSSEALAKNGLDLGSMQAKQMEKIEELTLYLIEQNKAIQKQSKEIETLKAQLKVLSKKK